MINKIKEHILTEENLCELVRLVNEEMDAQASEYRDRQPHHRGPGTPDSDLRQHQKQLEASQLELEAQLSDRRVELADLGLVTEYVEDLRNVLTYSSLAEQRAFIRSFVKEVKVTGNDALLTYTIPLPPDGIVREQAGVLNTVHDGGRFWI